MKTKLTTLLLSAALVFVLAPTAQAQDNDLNDVGVKIVNTIEAPAFGFEGENFFGEQGPVAINATIEFAQCCDGFYEVNLTGNQISMKWIGDAQFARVIEPGTYDRYYFTFLEPVLAGASLNPSSTLPANVTVTSPTEMLVEVAPGMEVGDGFNALIDVAVVGGSGGSAELAFTGVETGLAAVGGATAIAAGALLIGWSRRAQKRAGEQA